MKKIILALLLCLPFSNSFAADNDQHSLVQIQDNLIQRENKKKIFDKTFFLTEVNAQSQNNVLYFRVQTVKYNTDENPSILVVAYDNKTQQTIYIGHVAFYPPSAPGRTQGFVMLIPTDLIKDNYDIRNRNYKVSITAYVISASKDYTDNLTSFFIDSGSMIEAK